MPERSVPTPLARGRLRANPAYELVAFDALHEQELTQLGTLPANSELFGLLRPRDGGGPAKAIGHDTAALFRTLAEPAALDELDGDVAPDGGAVDRLVLGGVLEVEDGDRFVSGPAAEAALADGCEPAVAQTRLGRLSTAAIRYGAMLPIDDAGRLSARMYFFNRVPASPHWRRLLPDGDSVRRLLGVDGEGGVRDALETGWRALGPGDTGGWLTWRRARRRGANGDAAGAVLHKLYVSPAPENLAAAFDATLATLTRLDVPCTFKVGADVHGLLRPDKIVVYLASRAELEAVASELAPELEGLRPHGVPFSAELTTDGLLSWGVDPPRRNGAALWWERESWRLWVTNRLASAILDARANGSGVEPWRFALRRIEAEGVDPTTWMPLDGRWPWSGGDAT